jgi:putative PEP-CTERM system histidine kinase
MRVWLGLATLATAAWALAVVRFPDPLSPSAIRSLAEMLRSAALVGFATLLIRRSFPSGGLGRGFEAAAWATFAAWALAILMARPRPAALLALAGAVVGAICVENLWRNAARERRWSIKFGIAGLAAVFGSDFLLALLVAVQGRLEETLWAARGAVLALAAPLILVSAARNPEWRINLHVSREVVFHATAALAAGILIVAAALGGHYLRSAGGTPAGLTQILVPALAAFAVCVLAMSGSARSRLRNFIARHFFTYRYDWRREWLRFIATLAAGDDVEGLPARAIRAVADIVDSPGGALWLADPSPGGLSLAGAWNLPVPPAARAAAAAAAQALLHQDAPLAATAAARLVADRAPDLARVLAQAWIVLPLSHRGVRGAIALAPPRAPRDLGWEDYALLTTACRQVASYLAEDAAASELAGARHIDGFNRRFAFVVHDVKNMASQIQLILGNAERHAGDPAFVADMLSTLKGLSARMAALMGRLGDRQPSARDPDGAGPDFDAAAALHDLAADWPPGRVVVRAGDDAPRIVGDAARFRAALAHLVQNAVEASSTSAPVELTLATRGAQVAVVVADRGHGMDARFLRDELFVPLRTTKPAGSGLGAYQARTLLAEMGGALAVDSAPGRGTTVTVLMPRAEAS